MAGTEAEEAAWEMATAETLRARGELAEAANWYRRAANHLMEAGEDERAISVAKLAAELAALDDAGRSRSEKSMAPAGRASAAPKGEISSAAPTMSPAPPAKPSAAPKPPPPPPQATAGAARPAATSTSPAGTTGRQKLPWQRSSRPPPPKPAQRPSMAPRPSVAPKPAATTLAPTANKPTGTLAPKVNAPLAATGPVRPGLASRPSPPLGEKLQAPPVAAPKPLVSPPARPAKPAASAASSIDDAVTSQLDLGAMEATSFDATAQLRKSTEDDLTTESPLAALVDEAMSTLRKDRAAAASSEPVSDDTTAQRMPAISPERAAEFDAIAARLPALPLFTEFTADQVRMVARQAGVQHFQAGDNLTEAGAPEGPMYVIVEGEARIGVAGDESRTQSLVAGDFVGEISALFGGPRMATVMASGHVEAVALAPSMVRWMVNAIPSFGEAVNEAILDRMRTSLPHLAPMFRLLDAPQRKEAFAPFEFATLEAGDALVREGEITEALYVVGAGEVELYGGHGGAARPVRARQGEVVGLASIHGEEPATATVRAARRTVVAMISRAKYPAWIAKHPKLAQAVGDVGTLGRGVLC